MVPLVYHYLLVKETLLLVEVACTKCGRRRVLPRNARIEKINCQRCGHEIVLKRVTVS